MMLSMEKIQKTQHPSRCQKINEFSNTANEDGHHSDEEGSVNARKRIPFGCEIMQVLESRQYDDAMWWGNSGRSFIINPPKFQKTVMKHHFHGNQFESLTRKFNRYGFRRVKSSERDHSKAVTSATAGADDLIEFHHPSFIRGRHDLLKQVRIVKRAKLRADRDLVGSLPTACQPIPQPIKVAATASQPTPHPMNFATNVGCASNFPPGNITNKQLDWMSSAPVFREPFPSHAAKLESLMLNSPVRDNVVQDNGLASALLRLSLQKQVQFNDLLAQSLQRSSMSVVDRLLLESVIGGQGRNPPPQPLLNSDIDARIRSTLYKALSLRN